MMEREIIKRKLLRVWNNPGLLCHRLTGELGKLVADLLRQSEWTHPKYRVRGARTINRSELASFKNPFLTKRTMQSYVDGLFDRIAIALERKEPLSIIRVADGEALFLGEKLAGNIPRRHFTLGDFSKIDVDVWKSQLKANDIICFGLELSHRRRWVGLVPEDLLRGFSPFQVVYCLVSTRRIFSLFSSHRVGVIANTYKIDLIQTLLEYPAYQSYLGVSGFDQYVRVPQTGAANDWRGLEKDIMVQIDEPCDLYLVGIGIAKMAVLSRLRDELRTVIVDVGCGIDAIAGCVSHLRPYMADWVNFRLKDWDYSQVDQLDFGVSTAKKERRQFQFVYL